MDSSLESMYKNIVSIRKAPGDLNALKSLKKSYDFTQKKHLIIIQNNILSEDIFKWESDLTAYIKLNALYDTISTCLPCLRAVKPVDYESQEEVVRKLAAKARNSEGERLLATRIKADARTAYQYFTRANQIYPGFDDVSKKIRLSFDMASTTVLIDSIIMEPNNYQITDTQLNSRIQSLVDSCQKINRFLQFISRRGAEDSSFQPDQILVLKIYSYVIDKPHLKVDFDPIKDSISGKITHQIKTIASEGIMEIQIRDFKTKQIVLTDRLSGEHKWICEWWTCTGNPAGFTTEQLAKCKSQEMVAPEPSQLFTEFSAPLYDQVTRRLKNFYTSH